MTTQLTRIDDTTSQLAEQDGDTPRPIPAEPSAGYMILRAMEMMSVPGSGITVDTLERLVALKEREDAKKAERLLDAALQSVKRDCPQILKKRGAGMYRYANLEDVKTIIDPRIAKNDLSYTWDVEGVPGAMFTVCTVRHVGGGKRSARFPWAGAKAPAMNEAQAAGSSASYGQRYSLLAVLGLSADLDDDGRSANKMPAPGVDSTTFQQVGTREERAAANESTSAKPAAAETAVTKEQVKDLIDRWKASTKIVVPENPTDEEKITLSTAFSDFCDKALGIGFDKPSGRKYFARQTWNQRDLAKCLEAIK